MSFGAILDLIITISLNVPTAIAIIEKGIKAIQAAPDTKAKLGAVDQMLADIAAEVKAVLAQLP